MNPENPYQSPQFESESRGATPSPGPQSLSWILFSFQGRIPRRVFWGASLGAAFVFYGVFFALMAVFGEESIVPGLAMLVLYIPFIWASLAIQVKRWHDVDKSGWWIFIGLIPCIGPIWAFIEAGCMRGTLGNNSYGPDPT